MKKVLMISIISVGVLLIVFISNNASQANEIIPEIIENTFKIHKVTLRQIKSINEELYGVDNDIYEIEKQIMETKSLLQFIEIKKQYILKQNKNISEEDAVKIIMIILNEMEKYPIDFDIVLAQIKQESNFNINALGSSQDSGLMQLIPSTYNWIASELNINQYDIFDIETNIKMGMFYLNNCFEISKKYTNNENSQLRLALVAYNCGPKAYTDFKNKGKYRNEYHNLVLRHLIEIDKEELNWTN